MNFTATRQFAKAAKKLSIDVDALMAELSKAPRKGDLIPGARGLRKLRVALPHRGKRGGARLIYYYFESETGILLLFVYAKNEREDLDKEQLSLLAKHLEEYPHG